MAERVHIDNVTITYQGYDQYQVLVPVELVEDDDFEAAFIESSAGSVVSRAQLQDLINQIAELWGIRARG